jgi:hypothetical protein
MASLKLLAVYLAEPQWILTPDQLLEVRHYG